MRSDQLIWAAAIAMAVAAGCKREEPKPPAAPPTAPAPQPPASSAPPQSGVTTPAPGEPSRTVGQTVDDATITAKVKAALLQSPDVKGTAVNVDTVNGMVRLSGSVDSQSQADRATQIARDTEGVKQVESQLTVKSKP